MPVARFLLPFLAACSAAPPAASGSGALRFDAALSRGVLSYAVAFAGDDVVSVELATDFELVVRDGAREKLRLPLGPHQWDVADLAVREGLAYAASADGTVRAFELAGGAERARWHLGDAATAVAVSPDGAYLAAGGASGQICLRRLPGGELLQCLVAHRGRLSGLAFDPRGGRLAASSWDGRVSLWSVPALAAIAGLDAGGSANAIAFAPDGARLAIGTSAAPPHPRRRRDPRSQVLVWTPVRGGRPPRALSGHTGPVTAVVWVGQRILSASADSTVRLWDSGRASEIARVGGFGHALRDLAVSADRRRVAAAAWAPRPDEPATALLALRHPP